MVLNCNLCAFSKENKIAFKVPLNGSHVFILIVKHTNPIFLVPNQN